jgi:predicted nucleic acid-binding protein
LDAIRPLIRPLASRDTVEELIRVLCYPKFKLTDDEREDLIGDYLPWCETVTVPRLVALPPCGDAFDRPFLSLALTAKADALVTGDADLLAMADTVSVPILTPAAFRERMIEGDPENN